MIHSGSMWHFIAFLFQIFFYKVSKNKTSGSSTYLVLSTPLRLDKGDWVGQVTLCSFTFCSRTHKSFYKESQNSLDYARGYVEIMCRVKSLWSKFHECSQVGMVGWDQVLLATWDLVRKRFSVCFSWVWGSSLKLMFVLSNSAKTLTHNNWLTHESLAEMNHENCDSDIDAYDRKQADPIGWWLCRDKVDRHKKRIFCRFCSFSQREAKYLPPAPSDNTNSNLNPQLASPNHRYLTVAKNVKNVFPVHLMFCLWCCISNILET